MTSRKTTIFRQLIFNIVIPTLLALLIVATYNFYNTRSIISKGNDEKNTIISKEITKILKFQDIAFSLIDGELNTKFKELSATLVNKYFSNTDNIKNADLNSIRLKLGMDPLNEDIYIVSSNGVVINTTNKEDMGLDLFGFGPETKNYLLGVFKSGQFDSPIFAVEASTKRIKKYSYQPTIDGKYIIELGAYSKKADDIIQAIEVSKNQLKNETPGILDVELFMKADVIFCMNKDVQPVENQADTLLRSFQDKRTISFIKRTGKYWYQYQYIYMERSSINDSSDNEVIANLKEISGIKDTSRIQDKPISNLYKDSVIRIISDRTAQKALFKIEATRFIIVFVFTILMLSFLIYRKTRQITLPIIKLVENVDRITNGNLRERAEVLGNNEITRLSEKFNMMIAQLESYYYELEEKVKERTLKIEKQKEELSKQRDALEEKNSQLNEAYLEIEEQKKHIMDSIYYARRIQTAILPSFSMLDSKLKTYFIFYLPKDIVSGDFYWMTEADGKVMIAAVDCTGHGVPGAFMSIVGFNQLNNAVQVKQARKASDILDELNKGVISTLNENASDSSIKDGMDMTLCVFDFQAKKVDFAGANNPIILVRDNTPIKYKGDRFPIGAFVDNKILSFTNNEIDLQKGDMIYLFSDGYADQFGGPENKKFFTKRFENLLFEIHDKPLEEQKELLKTTLYNWMGANDQVDDVLVIGVKI
jgi:serine phosphatase RsbU (regulator of sigma subunit)